ncbi:choice-of-anchor D domain-containing protein [Panacibacter ginsenosidivorans]|nr:choice-of-anchor D domain-containing protein [Panacibacter ginsenosidivorans]
MKTNVLLYQIKNVLISAVLSAIFFLSCQKENSDASTTEHGVDTVGFGLIPTASSVYSAIPVAEIPPGGAGELPGSFFLEIPSVPFSQGIQGSCASCASAMAKSIVDHTKSNASYIDNGIIYSPSYLYTQAIQFPGSCSLGSEIYKNLDILKDKGICKLSEMAYSDADCSTLPDSKQDSLAAGHKIDHYFRVDPLDRSTIKKFIYAGLPVIVAIRVDDHFANDYWNQDNKNLVWSKFGAYQNTNHAVLLYGWDDEKNSFKILNQWGNRWGDNGSIWVDYDLVEETSVFFQAYIIQNPTNTNSLKITGDLNFGDVQVNTKVTKYLTLQNTGSSKIDISEVSVSAPYSVEWQTASVDAGKSKTLGVIFEPVNASQSDQILTIVSNAVNKNEEINVTGNGIVETSQTKIISISGDMDFGSIDVGTTASQTLKINNNGNSDLTVTSISYSAAGYAGNWSGVISAGDVQEVTVSFSPSSAQSYPCTLTVNCDLTGGNNTALLSGAGKQVQQKTRIISLSGDLSFGDVAIGDTHHSTLTIYNTGNSDLTINGFDIPGSFKKGSYTSLITPGASEDVDVSFSPLSQQNYTGVIKVYSDATSGSNEISVSGRGVAGSGGTVIVSPPIGSYGNCQDFGNYSCDASVSYGTGIINAKIVSVNTSTHTIVVEIKKCDGSAFNYGGHLNVVSDLCSGVSFVFGAFSAGSKSFQMTFSDTYMSGTKTYYPFIVQEVNSFTYQYAAPKISITY